MVHPLKRAADYLASLPQTSSIPPFGDVFRARAYDHLGQIWPDPSGPDPDLPCVGAALRAVTWNEAPGSAPGRGYQPKFLGMGGSISTMLALFPSVGGEVESHYWCTPGIELMNTGSAASPDPGHRFDAHMGAFAGNTLLPTHYDNYLNHFASTTSHVY